MSEEYKICGNIFTNEDKQNADKLFEVLCNKSMVNDIAVESGMPAKYVTCLLGKMRRIWVNKKS